MARAKERALRVVILMAAFGFIFSSAAVTILAVTSSNDSNQTDQQKLLEQLKNQNQTQTTPKEALSGYSAAAFDPAGVTSLQVETLVAGDGKAASAESTVNANYFGWTADGKIFDSTNSGGKVTPVDFPLNQVIPGWTEGLAGVKAGSTVKLTIPADKAYGAEDKGDGRPVGPLVFIIEVKEVK